MIELKIFGFVEIDMVEYTEICQSLVNYIRNEVENENPGFDTVIFIDRSARLAYLGFKELWKKENKAQNTDYLIPHIRFLNPYIFKNLIRIDSHESIIAEIFGKGLKSLDKFVATNKLVGKKVLLYDTCIHTGQSISTIKRFLKNRGIDLKIGVAGNNANFSRFGVDHISADIDTCLPFGCSSGLIADIEKLIHSKIDPYEDRETLQSDRKYILDRLRNPSIINTSSSIITLINFIRSQII